MKFVDYKIIQNTYQNLFQEEVIKHLRQGWTLQGGISITHPISWNNNTVYTQALVLHTEK
jgi:hypothetical protein